MFKINYIQPEEAQGKVKEIYEMFPDLAVPAPLQLYSASPAYLEKQMDIISCIMSNDSFSFPLLTALRVVGASSTCFEYCTEFNTKILASLGLTDDDIQNIGEIHSDVFEEKEAAMINFVYKAINDPDNITKKDLDKVRSLEWTDPEIFEATAYAAQMSTVGIVFRTFTSE